MSWFGRPAAIAPTIATGIRYTKKRIAVTAGGTATFQAKGEGRYILHTAAIYPLTDTNAQPCYIAIRVREGGGGDFAMYYESGWTSNARIFSNSRSVEFSGPAYIQLYYGGDTTQTVEFSVGVEELI